jgi:chaperonin GroEL (HSP60 family)
MMRFGDGTTTAAVPAGEFLKNAEELLEQGVHPTVIASGYRLASVKAKEILKTLAKPVTLEDKDLLLKIAVTAITGKGSEASRDVFADLAVNTMLAVVDKENGKYSADIEDIKGP